MTIYTRTLSQAEFASMRESWTCCLDRSGADPLFMSWPWLYTWWETWSESLQLELMLVGAFTKEGRLVGIGPFFRHRYLTPIGMTVHRLHVLGNAWRIAPTVRTEYTSLIVDQDHVHMARAAIFQHLASLRWDELIVSDISPAEADAWFLGLSACPGKFAAVTRSLDQGVVIDTAGQMDDWLKSLGSNTRLKLYNRRRYLQKKGRLKVACVETDREVQQFFEQLNTFHQSRWGKPCFDTLAVSFHLKLRARLTDQQSPCYSVMEFEGDTISLLYDIRAGQRNYNLQSGYVEDFDAKVSLGTLHFGFAIEDSFTSSDSHSYDLLAGFGKSTFYKQHLHGRKTPFRTVQFVRNPLLRFIYSRQASLPRALRQALNRFFRL